MGLIATVVLICVGIGAFMGFFGNREGRRTVGAVEGATQMGCASLGCLLQLAFFVIPILGFIWLLSLMFG